MLRVRGFAHERIFEQGRPARIEALDNGRSIGKWTLERPGLFVLEADVADAEDHLVEIRGEPVWGVAGDARLFTVNLSMIRLVGRQPAD